MSKNRELKEQAVAAIVEDLKNAQSVTICSYTGLTTDMDTQLRKQCREAGAKYVVLKNRLMKLALEQTGVTGLDDLLNGPNAFIFSMKDAVAGPKTVAKFIEDKKLTALTLTGGIVDGAAADAKTVDALAKMPSREEMLATIVGCLVSPISSLVAVLDEIAEQKATA